MEDTKALTRRNSLRYPGYDYSQPGCVFVTLCLHWRQRLFAAVERGEMQLSPPGTVAERMWLEIADRVPGIIVDAVVVMPDHLHGILMTGTDPAIEVSTSIEDIVHAYKVRFQAAYRQHVVAGTWQPYASQLWQRSYHDRIVRSDRELGAIREYIYANPSRWQERENP